MIAGLASALFLSTAAVSPGAFDFMSGYWLSCDGGREVYEVWTQAGDELRVGVGATIENGKASFDQFRIAPYEGGVAYIAQPQGGAATPFRLSELTAGRAVFRNPEHDFPQAVIYERNGDELKASIEGEMDGKHQVFAWAYHRAELNSHCP